jgi:Caspase domain
MNLAILIGVSNYGGNYNDLPGCSIDVQTMHDLLQGTGKYQSILLLNGPTTSQYVKGELSKFISSQKQNLIDEVFFYFTGHGDFLHEDFFYLFSDHDNARFKQTSLSNSELDQQLRALKPKLALKVIDACHSGVSYVKTPDVFQKYLTASGTGFEKCYFMFSSQANQKSYQSSDISDFTRSFLQSLENCSEQRIRYKDIIDFISDDFERNSYQTPFFVTQADFTELFWECTAPINSLFKTPVLAAASHKSPHEKKNELIDLVKKEAKDYCTQEEISKLLSALPAKMEKILGQLDLKELYNFTVGPMEDYKTVQNIGTVGNWLTENKNEYFAKPIVVTQSYNEEVEIKPTDLEVLIGKITPTKKTVRRQRDIATGFELLVATPFKGIEISAAPKYENLAYFKSVVLFTFSKIQIRFFYYTQPYKEIRWKERVPEGEVTWRTVEVKLKNETAVAQALNGISGSLRKAIEDPLAKRFQPSDSMDKKKTDSPTKEATEKKPAGTAEASDSKDKKKTDSPTKEATEKKPLAP